VRINLVLFAVVAAALTMAAPASPHYRTTARTDCLQARAAVVHYIAASRRWESFQGIAPRPYGGSARSPSCAYVRWAVRLWRARAATLADTLPPHHLLWMCIHGHEAADWHNPDTGHNGHYGGLQMHPGWGYGTSYLASADSQYVQEWAAERGYRVSGYSRAWLLGQWYHPDCASLAT